MATEKASTDLPSRKFIILMFPLHEPQPQQHQSEPETPLPPFEVVTRDGLVLRTVEEVTEHLLKPERLDLDRILQALSDAPEQ